jgi:RecB family endonuclease NucS
MPLYQLTHEALTKIPETTMQKQGFRERQDLQRLLKENISVIGDNLFVLAEEFSPWEDSNCRIDLLAMDSRGSLVVIELKRTEDGGHMDIQAVRYAAMVSALSFKQVTCPRKSLPV